PVEAVAVSPDDKWVATGGGDRTIRLWDSKTGMQTLVLNQKGAGVLALALSPNGQLLASSGSDGAIHLWEVASWKPLRTIRPYKAKIRTLAFSPDGKLLPTGGEDAIARLWDVPTAQEVATLPSSGAAANGTPDAAKDDLPEVGSRGWLLAAMLVFGLLCLLG